MNIEILNKYLEEGLLYNQSHPSLPLTIWNYTEKVQYEGLWDDVTLQCRGLVTDDNDNVVARPFKKFFNIEENKFTPTAQFDVFEKMDGSLGILFFYENKWVFASRGSFTSDQAFKFKEIFTKKYNASHLYHTSTYLFEIIYPENRIVVDYGDTEDIVMLAEINTETGEELDLIHYAQSIFNVVKKYDGIYDYSTMKGIISDNAEGFIVRFSNGNRIKIKGEEYIRLHKVITGLSTTAVWEKLLLGKTMDDLLIDVPDEFYDKIKEYEKFLVDKYAQIELICIEFFTQFKLLERKEYAQEAECHKYSSVLFALYSGKQYAPMIWRKIKPKFRKL